ncbi:MAG TPA: hypothetical protein VI755_15180 [Anaerolineales bacterium]|nr:hypothetical protein [Anaerolineales bacterium]
MLRKALFVFSILSLALMSFQTGFLFKGQSGPNQVLIFADGFESGNFSAWSAKVTDLGDLAVTSAAHLVGTKGMRALIDDNNMLYVQDNTPNNEAIYDIHFHFDPNSIGMANMDIHTILNGQDSQSTFVAALRVELRYSVGSYQIRAGARNDNLTWTNTSFFNISDAPHQIEVEWDGGSAPGQNDGKLKLKIDSVLRGNRTGIDNDTFRIDRVRLGAVAGIDNGTRGTYYFDQFESYR